jgi:hypothetical protein
MFKDLCMLCVAGVIFYDALTGRVSGRMGEVVWRKQHLVYYWLMTPLNLCIAAVLVCLAIYDFYRRFSS